MRVIALDLSYTGTGWCDGETSRRISTAATDGDTIDRALAMRARIADVDHGAVCDLVVVEGPAMNRRQGQWQTGVLHGIVRAPLRRRVVHFDVEIPPATLKKYATGRGNATKPDMRMALFTRKGLDLRDDNEVDAWWLWLAAADHYDLPGKLDMPKANREALDKVRWP